MARYRKQELIGIAEDRTVPRGTVARTLASDCRVDVHLVEASRMLTVDAEDGIWSLPVEKAARERRVEWAGSFVRLRPPADASDELVEAVRVAVHRLASTVRVTPRPKVGVIVVTLPGKRTGIRETVEVLLEEAKRHSRDGDALGELVHQTMAEVGL